MIEILIRSDGRAGDVQDRDSERSDGINLRCDWEIVDEALLEGNVNGLLLDLEMIWHKNFLHNIMFSNAQIEKDNIPKICIADSVPLFNPRVNDAPAPVDGREIAEELNRRQPLGFETV